jgi:NAD(P)-dependent dehydrogenase (short-subunit alcohol dehydrogenase family)
MQKKPINKAQARAVLVKDNPIGRFVQPCELSDSAVFLAFNMVDSIKGQAIATNGGEA